MKNNTMGILMGVLTSELISSGVKFSFEIENGIPTVRTGNGIRVTYFSEDNVIDYVPEKFYIRDHGYMTYLNYRDTYNLIMATEGVV